MNIRTAIIEDDAATCAIISGWLESAAGFKHLRAFPRPDAALKELPRLSPDVVLVDINLPVMSGVEFVRAAKPLMPATQFVMLTVYRDVEHIFAALSAGATGYLLKSDGLEHVADAVVELHRGGSPMTASIARRVIVAFQQITKRDAVTAILTERERQTLELLARGRIYKEIAVELGVSVATIRSHIFHIYQKLHVRTRKEAVHRWRFPFGWRKQP